MKKHDDVNDAVWVPAMSELVGVDSDRLRREASLAHVAIFDELDSTSSQAARMLQTASMRQAEKGCHPQLPMLVLAHRQTGGRGQRGRQWASGTGSLTFTLALDVPVTPLLPLTVGLALCQTIADGFPELRPAIKWPNDVIVNDRKVAGILVETIASQTGDPDDSLVLVGIGVNLHDRDGRLAQQLATMDASAMLFPPGVLMSGAGLPKRGKEFASDFLVGLIKRVLDHCRLTHDSPLALIETVRSSLWCRGGSLTLRLPNGETITGNEANLSEDGGLSLLVGQRPRVFYSASIVGGKP